MNVPLSALVHLALPAVKKFKLPERVTVHGKMAACLALWHSDPNHDNYQFWEKVWPTQADFKSTMPLYYSKVFQDLLPHAASAILTIQREKLEKDWDSLKAHMPSISRELFEYTWFIVNTRTFFWITLIYQQCIRDFQREEANSQLMTATPCVRSWITSITPTSAAIPRMTARDTGSPQTETTKPAKNYS